ncbi:MAG TPA: HAD hydrolase family protein [Thermoanaerobaculia bacterium]|nr:HAD hydrolase family protein [Thermoanaerobaculia bacterium]
MAFDLIVADIDGTLLNDEKELSEVTIETIRRVRCDFGVDVLLASSRMPCAIRPLQKQLGCLNTIVALDGALVLDGDATLVDQCLSCETSSGIVHLALAAGAHVGIFREDEWVVNRIDYWARREIRGNKVWPTVGSPLRHLESWAGAGLAAHKIMIRGEKDELDPVRDALYERYGTDVRLSCGRPTAIELVSVAAGKWAGVDCVLSRLGIAAHRVLAFGDSDNDLDLLRSVGHSVVPTNASDAALDVAREVTLSNTENGVAVALRKYFPETASVAAEKFAGSF